MGKVWKLTHRDTLTVLARHAVESPDRVSEAEFLVEHDSDRIREAVRPYSDPDLQRRFALSTIEDILIEEGCIHGPKLFAVKAQGGLPAEDDSQGRKKSWSYAEAQRTVPYVKRCLGELRRHCVDVWHFFWRNGCHKDS